MRGYKSRSSAASVSDSGNGHDNMAVVARRKHSCTVDNAQLTLTAICRGLKPLADNRTISRIFLMDNLACATVNPFCVNKKDRR